MRDVFVTNPPFGNKSSITVGRDARRRWRPFTYEEILPRDKVSLDLFWLRDESLEDSANLPDRR